MPRWQRVVSRLSAAALTVAFGTVTAMGVLLTAEVLAAGLRGLALGAIGGGLLTGSRPRSADDSPSVRESGSGPRTSPGSCSGSS